MTLVCRVCLPTNQLTNVTFWFDWFYCRWASSFLQCNDGIILQMELGAKATRFDYKTAGRAEASRISSDDLNYGSVVLTVVAFLNKRYSREEFNKTNKQTKQTTSRWKQQQQNKDEEFANRRRTTFWLFLKRVAVVASNIRDNVVRKGDCASSTPSWTCALHRWPTKRYPNLLRSNRHATQRVLLRCLKWTLSRP